MKICFYVLLAQLKTISKVFWEIKFSLEEEAEMMVMSGAEVVKVDYKKVFEAKERINEIRSDLDNLESMIDQITKDPYFLADIVLLKKSS